MVFRVFFLQIAIIQIAIAVEKTLKYQKAFTSNVFCFRTHCRVVKRNRKNDVAEFPFFVEPFCFFTDRKISKIKKYEKWAIFRPTKNDNSAPEKMARKRKIPFAGL